MIETLQPLDRAIRRVDLGAVDERLSLEEDEGRGSISEGGFGNNRGVVRRKAQRLPWMLMRLEQSRRLLSSIRWS